jgi:hypothetical protein
MALFDDLVKLGATPSVQELIKAWLAKKMGISQPVLDAAIAASKDAPNPKA